MPGVRLPKPLLYVLAFLWILVIFMAYFAGHKPFSAELALALALAAWRILAALGLVILAGGLGKLVLPGLDLPPLACMAVEGALGLGIFGLAFLAVGSLLGLPAWLLWLAPVALLVLLREKSWAWLRQARELRLLWNEGGRVGRGLAVLLGLLFLFTLVLSLAPQIDFDSLVEHLVMPNAYLLDGRVGPLPWIVFSNMPQNGEMLFTWAVALGGNQAAVVLHWAIGLLSMLGLLGYIHHKLDGRAAWVGASALLAGYSPVILLGTAHVDWLEFLCGLGVLVCLDAWRQSGRLKILLLAGLLAGLAVGTKYTAGAVLLAGLAVLAWQCWQCKRNYLLAAYQFGLAACAAVLPWLVKNGLATGNPFYPFFFASGTASQVQYSIFQNVTAWGNALDVFLVPLRATLVGFEQSDGYSYSMGPLLVSLAALAWVGWKQLDPEKRPAVLEALVVSLAGCLVWAAANLSNGLLIQTRYYIAVFPAFAVLAAAGEWGLRQVTLAKVRFGRLVGVMVLLGLGLNLLQVGITTFTLNAPQAVLGIKSEDSYLADNLGWFQPAMQAVRQLPQGSRVLLLYEPRGLYCQPRCTGDEIMGHWKLARTLYQDQPGRIQASWQAQGYTHLLVYRLGVQLLVDAHDPNHTPDDLQILNSFLATLPPPVKLGGVYELYSLASTN